MISIPVYQLVPHGSRADPQAAVSVQCAVDHHLLAGFRVPGQLQYLVLAALEVAVPSGSNFQGVHFLTVILCLKYSISRTFEQEERDSD